MIEFVVSTLPPCYSAVELQMVYTTDNVMLNNREYENETTAFYFWFLTITHID